MENGFRQYPLAHVLAFTGHEAAYWSFSMPNMSPFPTVSTIISTLNISLLSIFQPRTLEERWYHYGNNYTPCKKGEKNFKAGKRIGSV